MSATAFQSRRPELSAKLAKEEQESQNEVDPELEALKEKGKELGVKNWHVMDKEKLQEAIATKEAELEQEKELQELKEKALSLGIENVEEKDKDVLLSNIAEKKKGEGTGEGQQTGNESK